MSSYFILRADAGSIPFRNSFLQPNIFLTDHTKKERQHRPPEQGLHVCWIAGPRSGSVDTIRTSSFHAKRLLGRKNQFACLNKRIDAFEIATKTRLLEQ